MDEISETWSAFLALPHREQNREATAALRDIVADAGHDHVYQPASCVYVALANPDTFGAKSHGGDRLPTEFAEEGDLLCSCLIGHLLHRLGVPKVRLLELKGYAEESLAALGLVDNVPLVCALTAAQVVQDGSRDGSNRGTWGHALRVVETVLRYR